MVRPPAVAAARVLGRDKSIDMAAWGSVDRSTNELSVGDHADDDSGWASEGATLLPHSPALEEPGSWWGALAPKCPTGRDLRAPIWTRGTTATPLGRPLGAWCRAVGVASRSAPSRRRGETTTSPPPGTGLERCRVLPYTRFDTGPMARPVACHCARRLQQSLASFGGVFQDASSFLVLHQGRRKR